MPTRRKDGKTSRTGFVRGVRDRILFVLFTASIVVVLAGLIILIADVLFDGIPWLSMDFLTGYADPNPAEAGILPPLIGSLSIGALTAVFSFPLGVGAALYLEEYASKSRLTSFIQVNIANLAGVPSIVYGLLGLAIFVQALNMGRSIMSGAFTLTLLILPLVIIAAREAIRSVPRARREAAYALGATKLQVVREIVFPEAIPGILTGTILAVSRAIGEAAPMIAVSALVYITFLPRSVWDRYTVLPIQIFNWVSRPQAEFHGLASAAIIVLLGVFLLLNSIAIIYRYKRQARVRE